MKKMYHIGFDASHNAKYAILPGDPGRVEKIAQHLQEPRFHCQNREYTTWVGKLGGENVLVMSTGMGGPSAAIGVEELAQTGVHTMIRVGTTGGMAQKVIGGDVVVANSAIRMEGTTKEYVPVEYPAVADFEVTNALVEACNELGVRWHVGTVHCKDSFYGQHSPARMPVGYELEEKWNAWIKAGCLASEMESAALFIVGGILGVRCGCVLSVIWNQERKKAGLDDPHDHSNTSAIKTAVKAVEKMIQAEHP